MTIQVLTMCFLPIDGSQRSWHWYHFMFTSPRPLTCMPYVVVYRGFNMDVRQRIPGIMDCSCWNHCSIGLILPLCFIWSVVSIHPSIVTALSLLWGRGVFAGANPSCLWARAGYTLDKTPAHHRALTDGRGHHARCQLHIRSNLGFSILLKDTSTCSSAQPRAGIWTSDIPLTSQPARPT